ncbi:MAG TPA: L-seryl-tRNA(Sec) selenium transferase [Bryobacteraceae bacterium]|nr:L-seryl-tRNA(Sec) selenium transferase [Bryobacteraceae bacterium]
MAEAQKLRELPAVHEVLERLKPLLAQYPRTLVVEAVRRVLEMRRAGIQAGNGDQASAVEVEVERALDELARPSLRRVINATGVVLHTNLGRAPLGPQNAIAGYSNLEYDLRAGKRGKRDIHAGVLLERLLGCPAIAVNNNAAAVYLALNELAAGYEVIVSRGELIEIGDGFRIPEIMSRSGAVLREVGTTNRTSVHDYREAINERTRLLLRVHPSNFRIEGFTARPELAELVALGRERGIPVYEDLGSGCIVDLRPFGVHEPLVQESLRLGADLVSFSGDKLLGGPQAGILAGRAEMVTRLRRNPMFRALRLDKLIYQALENTLRALLMEQWDQVPTLRMIRASDGEIRERAERLVAAIPGIEARVEAGESVIGGGSTPEQSIPTWLIVVNHADVVAAEKRLRAADPPVIARIEDGRLLLDLRTVFPEEEEELKRALQDLG